MTTAGEKPGERPAVEPEIIPPDRTRTDDFRRGSPGGIFFDFRSANGTFQVKRISRFKLALLLIVAVALALAIVLTFASLFVVAAVVSACAVAVAGIVGWFRAKLR